MRELANMPDDNPKWILLDGDLDANWVESMNSVMDDSRLLTLPSNERIRLLPHMKMIFEIRDLKYATPVSCPRVVYALWWWSGSVGVIACTPRGSSPHTLDKPTKATRGFSAPRGFRICTLQPRLNTATPIIAE